MATKTKTTKPKRNVSRKLTKLAYEFIDHQNIGVAGEGYTVGWLATESLGLQEQDKLCDAASPTWKESKTEADKLFDTIYEKTELIKRYDDLRIDQVCAEHDVYFALGFATAVRILGR